MGFVNSTGLFFDTSNMWTLLRSRCLNSSPNLDGCHLMYLQFSVYDSPIPATFVRIPPSRSFSGPTTRNQQMTLVLLSELGEGASGKVHDGNFEMENPEGMRIS